MHLKMKSLVLIIIDESGSMSGRTQEVLDGFNRFIDDQKKIETDSARLFLIKFSSAFQWIHSGTVLEEVPPLSAETYCPNGSTALFDAVAEGIRVADQQKDSEERVICVIMTDGQENSSRQTNSAKVKELITDHESGGDWTFVYIGEDPEKWRRLSGSTRSSLSHYIRTSPMETIGLMNHAVTTFRRSTSRATQEGSDLFTPSDDSPYVSYVSR